MSYRHAVRVRLSAEQRVSRDLPGIFASVESYVRRAYGLEPGDEVKTSVNRADGIAKVAVVVHGSGFRTGTKWSLRPGARAR